MQAFQKFPTRVIDKGVLIPMVIEKIHFVNDIIEIPTPPFCPICEKYIIKNHCHQEIVPNSCPIERNLLKNKK